MACGDKLIYRSIHEPLVCYFCQEVKPGSISCINNHFVCDDCHGKDAFSAILDIALGTESNDPIEIAEQMMSHPAVTMIGGEHHAIVATSIMAALKNNGSIAYNNRQITVNDYLIDRTLDRTWTDRLPSCMCANYGACGAALSVGAVFSLLMDITCDTPKVRERQIAMEITNYVASEIAGFRGTCCKLSTRIAIEGACVAIRDYIGLSLPRRNVRCQHKKRNPYGCLDSICPYFKA